MRLLVLHPGSSWATHDVHVGLSNALLARGHEIHTYQLDARIERVGSWLMHCWRKAGKPEPRPSTADILYRAGFEALERALRFEVDGVLVITGMFVSRDLLELMRRAHLKLAIVFTESPYDDGPQTLMAPLADVCWTNERTSVATLRVGNPNTHYLPAAYNPDQHKFLDEAPSQDIPAHDVVFVGSGFRERIDILSAVDWSGIDLGLYGSWGALPSRHRLRRYLKGDVVDNRYAVDLYRRARIGLNLYRTSIGFAQNSVQVEGGESLNPRAYELAAVGAFQLSSHRPEVVERFGYAVPTFKTPEQLEALVREYLPLDKARRAAAQASRRQIEAHTFAARAAQIEEQLAQVWAQPLARGA